MYIDGRRRACLAIDRRIEHDNKSKLFGARLLLTSRTCFGRTHAFYHQYEISYVLIVGKQSKVLLVLLSSKYYFLHVYI